jgi:hypothetical protein
MNPLRRRRFTVVAGAAVAVALALPLGACEGVRDQLGLNKSSPDEFNVVTRAPLTLPPDYNLRPPDPGAPPSGETTVQDRVKAALNISTSDQTSGPTTAGENALLERAGVTEAAPDIRRLINEDNAIYAEDNDGFVDSLIFWQDGGEIGVIVDPTRENQRLQEAEALGETPTGDDTVIIEKREEGLFEGLFD